jgi:adenine phosphoribosyltransferase
LLATGGTLNAAIYLIEELGGIVEGIVVVNVIESLKGLERIKYGGKVFYIDDI